MDTDFRMENLHSTLPFGANNYLHTHFYEDDYIRSQDLT